MYQLYLGSGMFVVGFPAAIGRKRMRMDYCHPVDYMGMGKKSNAAGIGNKEHR